MGKTFLVVNKAKNISGRTCKWCGIDISHRSKGVEFCCPNCKALYKEKQESYSEVPIKANKPKINRVQEFNEKYGRN